MLEHKVQNMSQTRTILKFLLCRVSTQLQQRSTSHDLACAKKVLAYKLAGMACEKVLTEKLKV